MNGDNYIRAHLRDPQISEADWVGTGSVAPMSMSRHPHNGSLHPTYESLIAETIAQRAYELWVSCGEPEIHGDAVWQEAERELLTELPYRESEPDHHCHSR